LDCSGVTSVAAAGSVLRDRASHASCADQSRCHCLLARPDESTQAALLALSNAVTGLLAGRNRITAGTDVGKQQIRFHRCTLSKPVGECRRSLAHPARAHGTGWLLSQVPARSVGYRNVFVVRQDVDHNLGILLCNVVDH